MRATDVCPLAGLSHQNFDLIADEHKKLALNLMERLARMLANRLRYTDAERRVLAS